MNETLQNFVDFPFEIQQRIVNFLCQEDLISLTLTSKRFYQLSTKVLYSKIYLNDSLIESSSIYSLAPTWSWLELPTFEKDPDRVKDIANTKLKMLLRSFEQNKQLMNYIIELRLNWDLSIELQKGLVELLVNNSKSLKVIENITDQTLNDAIEYARYRDNLISIDIPPPNGLPTIDVPPEYLPNMTHFVRSILSPDHLPNIRNLTIFLEPLLLFNNIIRPTSKLKLETIKLHCRPDGYPLMVLGRNDWKFNRLSEIFDTNYLKVLTIISWYESQPPDAMLLFDQWREFKNLDDITLISVTYNDAKISQLIESCYALKRLKLDFSTPRRDITTSSMVYSAIFKHSRTLTFLDIKVSTTHRIINLDIREFKIMVRIPCKCALCSRVAKNIYLDKILGGDPNFKVSDLNEFRAIDFFDQFTLSSLSPYAKAVDKYPSVKTGPDDIDDFLKRFNEDNQHRQEFKPLNTDDFYDLYHCLIHSLRPDLEPFVANCPRLKFLVLNDISFMINESDGVRFPEPLFYHNGFKTNFGIDGIVKPKINNDNELSGPTVTLF